MIVYRRPIRFDEVDPAKVVFFARYAHFAHEAVENFFGSLEGGYPRLINDRGVGMPIVHLDADFRAPLRYGDELVVATSVEKLGSSSAAFVHEMASREGGPFAAVLRMIVVAVELAGFRKCPMPDDARAVLAAHLR